jgi:hypothetical protein
MEPAAASSKNDAPVVLDGNRPSGVTSHDAKVHLSGQWYIIHSTRSIWRGKRNARVTIAESGNEATYTYQEPGDSAIHELIISSSQWEVLGKGKAGHLASWMRETPYGIEDSSGTPVSDPRPNIRFC